MAKTQRRGSETSETRTLLLDVTERIMIEDGYAAISSRSVAKAAEVTPALVHYYFGTLDDLFVAVLRRRSESNLVRQQRMLEESARPFRALWDAVRDPRRTGVMLELVALANHRKSVQVELAALSTRLRAAQVEALEARLGGATGSGEAEGLSALAAVTMINSIAAHSVLERSIGVELGHDDQARAVEHLIDRLDAAC